MSLNEFISTPLIRQDFHKRADSVSTEPVWRIAHEDRFTPYLEFISELAFVP